MEAERTRRLGSLFLFIRDLCVCLVVGTSGWFLATQHSRIVSVETDQATERATNREWRAQIVRLDQRVGKLESWWVDETDKRERHEREMMALLNAISVSQAKVEAHSDFIVQYYQRAQARANNPVQQIKR